MITKATEYRALTCSSLLNLNEAVNFHLNEGWLLYGPLIVTHGYIQVMVRQD